MSNYISYEESNIFRVTDKDKLIEILKNLEVSGGDIQLYTSLHKGKEYFNFYVDGEICGLKNGEDEESDEYEYSYDDFIKALQSILPRNQCVVITGIGHNGRGAEIAAWINIISKHNHEWKTLSSIVTELGQKYTKRQDFNYDDVRFDSSSWITIGEDCDEECED